jgi:hypothetical protein
LLGTTREIYQRDLLEKAYEVPFDFLKRREALYRESLRRDLPGT